MTKYFKQKIHGWGPSDDVKNFLPPPPGDAREEFEILNKNPHVLLQIRIDRQKSSKFTKKKNLWR